MAVVLVSISALGGIVFGILESQIKSVNISLDPNGKNTPVPKIEDLKGGINILVVSSDTRQGQGDAYGPDDGELNNDVNILFHLSADHKHVVAMSIPRDLVTTMPTCKTEDGKTHEGGGMGMFNSTLQRGGLACVVQAARLLTGVDIPYAALVTFNGVLEMSNAVGGVDVCLATPVKDTKEGGTGINLPAGKAHLQGQEAVQFLRMRHGIGDGSDNARISNQQMFLSALARKIKSTGTLSNPAKVLGLAQATTSNMTLSTGIDDPSEIAKIAFALKDVPLENIQFVTVPVYDAPRNGPWAYHSLLDDVAAKQLFALIQHDQPLQVQSGDTGDGTTVQNTATATPSATAPQATNSPSATASPDATSSTSTPAPVTTLPGTVKGQNASEQTCAVGNK